jgi:hypothetical protein
MPWDTDGRTNLFFWLVALAVSAVVLPLLHWRDTSHGDRWDWFDWVEAAVGSVSVGIVVVGLAWVLAGRLATRRG